MEYDSIIYLIRLGVGQIACFDKKQVDWKTIETLAAKQGLLAIVIDGIEQLRLRVS